MAEVVGIRGEPVAAVLPANEHVVGALEGLLEAARSGRVIAVAWAAQYQDETVTWHTVGTFTSVLRMIGALEVVKHDLLREQVRND